MPFELVWEPSFHSEVLEILRPPRIIYLLLAISINRPRCYRCAPKKTSHVTIVRVYCWLAIFMRLFRVSLGRSAMLCLFGATSISLISLSSESEPHSVQRQLSLFLQWFTGSCSELSSAVSERPEPELVPGSDSEGRSVTEVESESRSVTKLRFSSSIS